MQSADTRHRAGSLMLTIIVRQTKAAPGRLFRYLSFSAAAPSRRVTSRLRLFCRAVCGRAGLSCLAGLSSRQHRGCRSCATARWSVTRSAVLSTKSRFASRFLVYWLFYMTRRLIMSEKCRVASAHSMIVPLTFRCRPEQWRDCLCDGRCGALLRPQRGFPAAAAGAARAEPESGSHLLPVRSCCFGIGRACRG